VETFQLPCSVLNNYFQFHNNNYTESSIFQFSFVNFIWVYLLSSSLSFSSGNIFPLFHVCVQCSMYNQMEKFQNYFSGSDHLNSMFLFKLTTGQNILYILCGFEFFNENLLLQEKIL